MLPDCIKNRYCLERLYELQSSMENLKQDFLKYQKNPNNDSQFWGTYEDIMKQIQHLENHIM